MLMSYQNILYKKKDGIAAITFNRPKTLNAVTYPMMEEIKKAMDDAENDPSVRVLIFKGAGRAFSSGADVKEMDDVTAPMAKSDPHAYIKHIQSWEHSLLVAIRKFEKPTIAQVKGYAIGVACGMALCCDMRVVSEEAKFGPRFVKMGLVPGDGDSAMLTALVGFGHAMEYLLTGEYITAQDAYRMGLANRLVPLEQLEQATLELAQTLMDAAPRAVASVKVDLNRVLLPLLESDLEFSVRLQSLLKQTNDHKEALQAFLEKRKPKFTGR
jgi:enoyl-CoA hydratase/carnithine racemase